MKIALIADIQGNALALQTALTHIQQHSPDHIISLGDVASGPQPLEILKLLQAHQCKNVMGNMDAVILNPQPYDGDNETEQKYAEMDQWCFEQLSDADKSYLSRFQATISIPVDDNLQLVACHGSPTSFDDVLVATTPENKLLSFFASDMSTILAVGHMHEAVLHRFRNHWLINPGSIGLPHRFSTTGEKLPYPLVAEYAIVRVTDGYVNVAFHQVPYDGSMFRQAVLGSGMPYAEWFLGQWQV